jgi:hypothetical protein
MRALTMDELSSVGGGEFTENGDTDETLKKKAEVIVVTAPRNAVTVGGQVGDTVAYYVMEFVNDFDRPFEPWFFRPIYDAQARRFQEGVRNGVADFVNNIADEITQSEKDSQAFWDPGHGVFSGK